MADELNAEQQNFIDKLTETNSIFNEIFSKDPNGMVIPFGNERNELERLRKRNERILTKLRTKEFTVAVVGLEKAGKSTLGNALLKRNILPEYSTRCTYTTTKICAGDQDHGKVFFYSREQFKNNFADTLKKVLQYPQPADFDTMDLTSFSRWWDSIADKNPAFYKEHDKKTAADVKVMLQDRSTIGNLLGQTPKDFYDGALETNDFKIFITGIKGKNADKSTIRTGHPYAVKEVIIESANLGEMKDIVLYDVPGFNSPTELHEKQTMEMLREADAIILVTNVGTTPNLERSQLTVLRSGRDEENIPLSDKAFVFGNQIDRANSLEEAEINSAELRKDSLDNNIAKENHIFVGSARAYLESQGILRPKQNQDKDDTKSSQEIMNGWQMPYGIDELWTSMTQYYDTDRFAVLKRRAENTIADARNFLDGILKKYESAQWQPIETGGEYYLEAKDLLRTFKRAAYKIAVEHNQRILETQPFSQMIREQIENFYPTQAPDSELLLKVKSEGDISGTGQLSLAKTDSSFREALEREFLRHIVEATARVTEEEEQKIYRDINEKFLEVMGMPADSPHKDELTESVTELFDSLWIKNADRCRFNSLVERFTSGLMEALIRRPFGMHERLQLISREENFPEFLSLATYYENFPEANPDDRESRYTDFFVKIFLHDNTAANTELEGTLKKFFKANKDAIAAGISLAVEILPFGKWAKLLLRAGVKANEMPPALRNKFQEIFYKPDWSSLSRDDRINRLNNAVDSYSTNNSSFAGRLTREKLQKMHELSRQMQITSEEDMLRILNEDIEILREFTREAIISAIGLERAFIYVMTKNINIIRNEEETKESQKIFNKWIADNIRKIREQEFIGLDRRNLENQTKQNIVQTIRKVVDNLG